MLSTDISSGGLTLGGGVHTTLGDVECPDWEFPTHPDVRVTTIKQV